MGIGHAGSGDAVEESPLAGFRCRLDQIAVEHHQHLGDRPVEGGRLIPFVGAERDGELRQPFVLLPGSLLPLFLGLIGLGGGEQRLIELLGAHLPEIEMRELRLLPDRGIVGGIPLGDPTGERVGVGESDPADELLRVEALLAEPLAEAVEQFGVRRRVVITQIVDRTGESIAEEVAPDPIHRGLRHQWAVDNQLRQGLATVHTVLRAILQLRREITVGVDGRAVDEHRIGDFHLAIAELVVELGLSGIPPFAGPILVD